MEMLFRLFLSIDMSLQRSNTNIFRGCAKVGPLAFTKIQYGRRDIKMTISPSVLCGGDIHLVSNARSASMGNPMKGLLVQFDLYISAIWPPCLQRNH